MCPNGIHCTRIWVGLSAGLDDMEYLASTGIFPRTIQTVASRWTDYAITARPFVQENGAQLCGAYVDWCTPSFLVFRFLLLSIKF